MFYENLATFISQKKIQDCYNQNWIIVDECYRCLCLIWLGFLTCGLTCLDNGWVFVHPLFQYLSQSGQFLPHTGCDLQSYGQVTHGTPKVLPRFIYSQFVNLIRVTGFNTPGFTRYIAPKTQKLKKLCVPYLNPLVIFIK